MTQGNWFHWYGGIYFRRGDDGAVHIGEGTSFTTVTTLHRIDPASWGSIVSFVSAHGEDSLSFGLAEAFHAGQSVVEKAMRLAGWSDDRIGAAMDAAAARA